MRTYDDTSAPVPPAPDGEELPPFPMARTCPYRPPAGYDRLTEQGPVARARLFDGRVVWCVTGHAETRELLLDHRLSSDWQNPGFPVVVPRGTESMGKIQIPLIGVDDPHHARHRRLVMRGFTARRVKALRPQIQEIADGLLDAMERRGPTADLVAEYALPLSVMVICRLLGVPVTDREFFEEQTRRLLTGPEHNDIEDARLQLLTYLDGLLAVKAGTPGEGLLDELVAGQAENGAVDRHELVGIGFVLLLGGIETTANMIALSTFTLLEHPEQTAELRSDENLLPGAVEELLRFLSVTDGIMRVAGEEIEIGGRTIAAGDGVFFPVAAANRDPFVYEAPDTLDLHRPARSHLAFGHGSHQCVGQNLARHELEIALHALFGRFPDLSLAVPSTEIAPRSPEAVQGVTTLTVTW
ncbi:MULTISPECIES: cytochrome P450 [unclassified Streptomyces]|uniref:cytochrome P450 n=1 Tax=unclassified Streptomyces TaxID=2593676 RepID=UPI003805F441